MKTKILIVLAVVIVAAAALAAAVYCALYRVVPQPASLHGSFYRSVDAGAAEGVPYWIWLVLPRIFPDYVPGTGGYAAFGLSWQETKEMPVGFAKQRVGYIRVTGNCALCHAIRHDRTDGLPPDVTLAYGAKPTDIQPLLDFYRNCARDPRFTADDILAEVGNATKLSLADRLLYRCVLIPRARRMLLDANSSTTPLFGPTIRQHIRDPKAPVPEDGQVRASGYLPKTRSSS